MNLKAFEEAVADMLKNGIIRKEDVPKYRQDFARHRYEEQMAGYQGWIGTPSDTQQPAPGQYEASIETPRAPNFIPAFGIDPYSLKITAMGMLYLRLTWDGRYTAYFGPNSGKFGWGDIAIVDALTHMDITYVYTFIKSKGTPLIIEDDANLFPSDELIVKLTTLRDVHNGSHNAVQQSQFAATQAI